MCKLMNKPDEATIKYKEKSLFYGKDLEDYVTNSIYNDWCRFYFPKGVKKKIQKEKMYKVWFEYSEASDPMDSSCSYCIYYIEEVPEDVEMAYLLWQENEKIVDDYLKKQ